MVVDDDGRIYVSSYKGASLVDFGDGPTTEIGGWVASWDSDGAFRFRRMFRSLRGNIVAIPRALAVGRDCVVAVGSFNEAVDFGMGPRTPASREDGYVVCLDPETGETRWDVHVESPTRAVVTAVAVDVLGNVAISGYFEDAISIGDQLLEAPSEAAFLIVLDREGRVIWVRRDALTETGARAIVASPEGGFVFVFAVVGRVDFGGGPVETGIDPESLLVGFDPTGTYRSQTPLFGIRTYVQSLRSAPDRTNLVTGIFYEHLSIGPYAIDGPPGDDARPDRGFLARFDPRGDVLGLTRTSWPANAVAARDDGSVIVGGYFLRTYAELDGCPVLDRSPLYAASPGGEYDWDGFLASLDATGHCEWLLHMKSQVVVLGGYFVVDTVHDVRRDAEGATVFLGYFNERVEVGDITLTGEPRNIYIAKLLPD